MKFNVKMLACLVASCSAVSFSQARTGNIHSGSSMTSGPSSNPHSLFSGTFNPAMGELMVEEREKWRLNYLPSMAFEFEVGPVDNFEEDLDDLIDLIDDPSLVEGSLEDNLEFFNDVVIKLGDDGYSKVTMGFHAPLFPMYFKSETLAGTLSADFSVETQIGVRVLDDVLIPTTDSGGIITNTSLYLKSGIEKRFSVGYSYELADGFLGLPNNGAFYAGIRASLIDLELSKQVIWLQDLDGQEVSDYVEDNYDNNVRSNTNIGIDVGLLWISEPLSIGLTVTNINAPSFDYGDVGIACDTMVDGSFEKNSCFVADFFITEKQEIKARESHTKHAVATLDGSYKLTDKWNFSSALDLAVYDDIVGQENQRFHLSTAYETSSLLGVSTRIGYQTNLAGSNLSSINAGATLFNVLALDFIYGLETTEVDGSSLPRKLGFSLAFEEKF